MAANGNPADTREAILSAATVEFAAKGLAGARVDAIASRAAVNKQLIYRYFGDKHGLFGSVLERLVARRQSDMRSVPTNVRELFESFLSVPDEGQGLMWVRLATWEALEGLSHANPNPSVLTDELIRGVRVQQRAGTIPASLDPGLLVLAAISLAIYPWAFPQVTEEVCGSRPEKPEFRQRHESFLGALADLLQAGAGVAVPDD